MHVSLHGVTFRKGHGESRAVKVYTQELELDGKAYFLNSRKEIRATMVGVKKQDESGDSSTSRYWVSLYYSLLLSSRGTHKKILGVAPLQDHL